MKELTIEQKAQRYDEALKKAKDFYKGYRQRDNQLYADDLESIFPELKESEDELTWLTKYIEEEAYSLSMDIRDNEDRIKLEKLQKSLAWLEKQAEQKPADEVEPKFKDGDYIVYRDYVWKVFNISLEKYYELLKINNEVATYSIEDVDNNAHLWTIQDIKDGDVLALNGNVFIYAHRKQMYSIAVAHCFADNAGGFYLDGEFGYMESGNLIHPATKEQRDQLEKAMADAGYTFDFEKKELKKIEDEYRADAIAEIKDEPQKELAETYLTVFDKKFPILPTLKGKQLADYKNFLNKCQQIFGLKYWGIRPLQAKLFEKLSLLWAAWGAEHLQGLGQTDGDIDNEREEWSENKKDRLNMISKYLRCKGYEDDACWLESLKERV